LGGGPPGFPRGSSCPAVLGILSDTLILSPTGLLPSVIGLSRPIRLGSLYLSESPATPTDYSVGLGSSRFARRYLGNRVFFLFLWVLRCFSSPGCLHTTIYSLYDGWILLQPGCPIRISPDLCLLAAPRSFSQLTTSFFDSWRQGIHRTLLLT
jgi:hypothetical protein